MKPVICNYYLTYRCNARCGFCTIWRNTTVPKSGEASPETVMENLSVLRSRGVRIVDFTGGEPLLYDALPAVLRFAKSLGLRTTVTTNGIAYPGRAEELTGLVDYLQFSLHGTNEEEHDRVTVTPSFARIIESVAIARKLGDRPTFIHTVSDENIGNVRAVISFARSMKTLMVLNPCFEYPGAEGLSRENARRLIDLSRGKGVVADRGYLAFAADGGNKTARPRCLAVSSTIVISPDNRLLLPCYHRGITSIPLTAGLNVALDSPERAAAQAGEGRYSFCEGCAIYCYIRASLIRKPDVYFLPSVISGLKYLFERRR